MKDARRRIILSAALAFGFIRPAAGQDAFLSFIKSGDVFRDQGRYREALREYGRALQQASQPVPDRPAIATAHNGLGITWLLLRDFGKAEMYLRHALNSFEAMSPGQHETARILLNLTTLLRLQNRLADAEEASRRAVGILEKDCGPEDSDLSLSLNNRGELLFEMSRCREALDLFERAYTIWRSSLGERHLHTAAALNNIGSARLCLGEYREALHALKLALHLREQQLGPQHPAIAQTLVNYAAALENIGDRKQARSLRRRAETIRSRLAGDELIGFTVDARAFR